MYIYTYMFVVVEVFVYIKYEYVSVAGERLLGRRPHSCPRPPE